MKTSFPAVAAVVAPVLLAGCAGLRQPGVAAEPAVQHLVTEDEAVRIAELRVRGQTQQLQVTPKLPGARAYEIELGRSGQDTSQPRDGLGQRVWSLFSF